MGSEYGPCVLPVLSTGVLDSQTKETKIARMCPNSTAAATRICTCGHINTYTMVTTSVAIRISTGNTYIYIYIYMPYIYI